MAVAVTPAQAMYHRVELTDGGSSGAAIGLHPHDPSRVQPGLLRLTPPRPQPGRYQGTVPLSLKKPPGRPIIGQPNHPMRTPSWIRRAVYNVAQGGGS